MGVPAVRSFREKGDLGSKPSQNSQTISPARTYTFQGVATLS